MKFGFGVATRGPGASPEFLKNHAQHGERLGFDIVTVSDHVIIPKQVQSIYPYSEDGAFSGVDAGECLEQLTLATYLAANTSNIRLLTSVMVVPHRPPVLAAKTLASLDVLSGGRLTVGVGAGWMREEFEALDTAPYEHRGSVTNDYIRAFKEMWTNDYISIQPTGVIGMGNVMKVKNNDKSVTLQSDYVKKNVTKYVSGDDSCSSKPIQMDSSEHFENKHKQTIDDELINNFIRLYIIMSFVIFLIIIINKNKR